MASYIVMEPAAASIAGRAEGAVLVRDGFSLLAFLLPVPWLLLHRLWLEALLALAATLALGAVGSALGLGQAAPLLSLLVSLFFGLEANQLRIRALARRGWSEWGALDADDREDAEIRYLAGMDGEADAVPFSPPTSQGSAPPRPGPALGLFAYPGSR